MVVLYNRDGNYAQIEKIGTYENEEIANLVVDAICEVCDIVNADVRVDVLPVE